MRKDLFHELHKLDSNVVGFLFLLFGIIQSHAVVYIIIDQCLYNGIGCKDSSWYIVFIFVVKRSFDGQACNIGYTTPEGSPIGAVDILLTVITAWSRT